MPIAHFLKETNASLSKKLVDPISYKTQYPKQHDVKKSWLLVDARAQTLGRLASQVARIIRGKHKPSFTPHIDGGDIVIIINADKIKLTGKKWDEKQYISHTGYPGGQRVTTPRKIRARSSSTHIIEHAVKGMLPKNRLGRKLLHHLFVYEGEVHRHAAQQPKTIALQ